MDRPFNTESTAEEKGDHHRRRSGPPLSHPPARNRAFVSNLQRRYDRNAVYENKHFNHKPLRPLNTSDLRAWAENTDAGDLILSMCNQITELEIYMNRPYKEERLTLLVNSVSFAITAQHHKASVRQLMDTVRRSPLLDSHLSRYLTDKQTSQAAWTEAKVFMSALLKLIKTCVEMFPDSASKYVVALWHLRTAVKNVKDVCQDEALLDSITQTLAGAREIYERNKGKGALKGLTEKADNSQESPNDFRSISVFPTNEDLKENTWPLLRCAITNGEYENVLTYLDIQFKLMREDFILPLRQSLNLFKASECSHNFSSFDLRIYTKVCIIGGAYNDDGLNHVLQFDVSGMKSVNWDTSKRLIYGSLLCLSKDKFQTALFATVADHDRDTNLLSQGFITVNFKNSLDLVFNGSPLDEYTMIESVVYFESYVHVLKGLQEMSTELPLSKYIVSCKKVIKPPKYLLPCGGDLKVPVYNLSCLMNDKNVTKIPVLNTRKWPSAEEMCLNQSQREAVISALTKELALIQGPPGTGKTFVGLKVMEILLAHKIEIHEDEMKPILVVCYTNHALDQFLEGVLKFCPEGIVRVGGKCSSEPLKVFNLSTLKKDLKKDHSLTTLKDSRRNCMDKLKNVSKGITDIQNILHKQEYDILSEQELKRFIRNKHFESLTRSSKAPNQCSIRQWLNAPKMPTMAALTGMLNNCLSSLILQTFVPLNPVPKWTKSMNVIMRVTFYKCIMNRYKDKLYKRKQYLLKQSVFSRNMNELESIDFELGMLKTEIPSDRYTIMKIFPSDFVKFVNEHYKQADVSKKDGPIKYWLLGQDRSLHCLLDDIEILRRYASSGKYKHTETLDDKENVKQAEASRLLDGEDAKEREYVSQLTKTRSNVISLVKRVESLGISEDYIDHLNKSRPNRCQAPHQLSYRDVRDKLRSTPLMSEEEVDAIDDLWSLNVDRRFSLYKHWIHQYTSSLTTKMGVLAQQYSELFDKKTELSEEENLMILKKAEVIGMTTTGAAKHRSVLQALGCRIIIVEEAAEVLESHIITSLNKHCSHLILIGDHQQLRPKPAVYELAKHFNLDVSLFERLVKNGLPHTVLQKQHRMRPEISKLLRLIYPDLQDHENVERYEHVRGMSRDVFFISHKKSEEHDEESQSISNSHEALFIVELCKYLLLQGYEASQITLLTTYSGQVHLIKKTMRDLKLAAPVRVTSVDNFQGEENDIVLLSLVRSNEENKAGFLKVDNRICVALSRAKKGLYVIGNFDMMSSQSRLWHKIVDSLKDDNFIDDCLPVKCPNHSDRKQLIHSKADFKKCPEGGCGQACGYRLDCGHVCEISCHGYDPDHRTFACQKACIRKCPAGHPCKLKCLQTCQCKVLVDKIVTHCGHLNKMFCHIPPEEAECTHPCAEIFECGHLCSGKCGSCREKEKHAECHVKVDKDLPCGHLNKIPCCIPLEEAKCSKACTATLECGHLCSGKCASCREKEKHAECHVKVNKDLPCGHINKIPCCIPLEEAKCSKACTVTLECGHLCSGQCISCTEKHKHKLCLYKVDKTLPCGHTMKAECGYGISELTCDSVCGALLDCGHACEGKCNDCLNGKVHVGCVKKCDKTLPCGHPCDSVCGLPCTPCCRPCPTRCRHENCMKSKRLCGQPCSPCKKKCLNKCQHRQCKRNCSEPCGVQPCARKCCKKLFKGCRHKCSGLCGELCVCAMCETIFLISQENKIVKSSPSTGVQTCPISGTLQHNIQVEAKTESENQNNESTYCNMETLAVTESENQNKESTYCNMETLAVTESENQNKESTYCNMETLAVTESENQNKESTHCNNEEGAVTESENRKKELISSNIEEPSIHASANQINEPAFPITVERADTQRIHQINEAKHSHIEETTSNDSTYQINKLTNSNIEKEAEIASENQNNTVATTEITTDTNIKKTNFVSKKGDIKKQVAVTVSTSPHPDRLILKIPSCFHNFFVDEIDEYVKNYDADGTKFIPCPKCSTPIQKCNRYKNINLERYLLREEMKKNLMTAEPVSADDKEKLNSSKMLLRRTTYFVDIQDIDVSKTKTKSESQTLSFLVKTVFLLNEIAYIDDEACGLMPSVDRMRTALEKIKQRGRVTEQQERELRLELLRCLNLACLTQLEWLLKREGQPLKETVAELIQQLQGPRPDTETLDLCHKSVLVARDCLVTNRTSLSHLNDSYDEGRKVLLSRDEHLCDIISVKRV